MNRVVLSTAGDAGDRDLARSACAAVASLADFTVDRIADAQSATAEAVALFGRTPVTVTFAHEPARVHVEVDGVRIPDAAAAGFAIRALEGLRARAEAVHTDSSSTIRITLEGGPDA